MVRWFSYTYLFVRAYNIWETIILTILYFHSDDILFDVIFVMGSRPLGFLILYYNCCTAGYIWQEILDVRRDGLKRYLAHNAWNYVEFARNKIYIVVITLRVYAYVTENSQILADPSSAFIPREKWETFDPQLLADALFAAANILR